MNSTINQPQIQQQFIGRKELTSYNPQNNAVCALVSKFKKLCAIQCQIRAVEAEKDRIQMQEIMRQQALQQEQALMSQSRSHSVIQYQQPTKAEKRRKPKRQQQLEEPTLLHK